MYLARFRNKTDVNAIALEEYLQEMRCKNVTDSVVVAQINGSGIGKQISCKEFCSLH